MRTTTFIAVVLLLASSTAGLAGGPGRNLRPGLTRSTQVTALSPGGPTEPAPTGPLEVVVSFSAAVAAVIITAVRKIERHR